MEKGSLMKNILLVTTKYGIQGNQWLTNELANELKSRDYKVYVIALSWLKDDPETSYKEENEIKVYRYKLPKLFFSDFIIIKFIKQFIFQILALRSTKKHLKKIKFDLIIGFTPALLTSKIVKYYQKLSTGTSYLILWDFFPYYLLDLNLLKSKLFFQILKILENRSYLIYKKIGCMTKRNKEFLLMNYKGIDPLKLKIIPIWAKISSRKEYSRSQTREILGYKKEDIIFVYGGAHSIVQELDNIINLAKKLLSYERIKFIFIGKGTDKERLKKIVNDQKIVNIKFLDYIPREKYEEIIASFDIGIVSLSSKLTVPSFPSKSLDYLKVGLPIIASIDKFTDYGNILENEIKGGYASIAGDEKSLLQNALKLVFDEEDRNKKGENGRRYYEQIFSVENICNKILSSSIENENKKFVK